MTPLTSTALALPAARRHAMQAPVLLDGVWRGTARVFLPDGRPREPVSAERVGPMPVGVIQVIGRRGHGADGRRGGATLMGQ